MLRGGALTRAAVSRAAWRYVAAMAANRGTTIAEKNAQATTNGTIKADAETIARLA